MRDLLFAAAVTYCVAWLTISLAWNLRILPKPIGAFCRLLFVIPEWAFFAPNPLISDYRVSVRRICASSCDSHVTPLHFERAGIWRIAFNPAKRPRKFLDDVISLIFEELRVANSSNYREVHVSLPYLLLLNFARSQVVSRSVARIVIIIEESRVISGHRVTHTLFESVGHRV